MEKLPHECDSAIHQIALASNRIHGQAKLIRDLHDRKACANISHQMGTHSTTRR